MTATTMQTNVLVMTDARVARGQAAWSHIKATAEQQREAWRDIGEALLVGRRANPSNNVGFGKWVKAHGFDDMPKQDRHGAMWLAENWTQAVTRCDRSISHPRRIREFLMNEPEVNWEEKLPKAKADGLPPELQNLNAETKTVIKLDHKSAATVGKLHNRHQSGGEGSEKAGRNVEAVAKQKGVAVEDLLQASADTAPEVFYQFSVAQLAAFDSLKRNVLETIPELEAEGLSKEAIASMFVAVAQMIRKEI